MPRLGGARPHNSLGRFQPIDLVLRADLRQLAQMMDLNEALRNFPIFGTEREAADDEGGAEAGDAELPNYADRRGSAKMLGATRIQG
jgi:hypothetical protein